jgi:hypothetical protein
MVTNQKEFDETDITIYESSVMEQYTVNFGYELGEPFIMTNCTVISQLLASRRKRYHLGEDDDAGDEEPKRRLGNRKNGNQYQQKDRQLQTVGGTGGTETLNTLVMTFTMNYTSRYGYDISEYPSDFKTYVQAK